MSINQTRIVIPARVAFLHCFKPYSFSKDGSGAKFMATPIIPKQDWKTLKKIRKAIQAAINKGKVELWQGKLPSNLQDPLKDGDEKGDVDFADSMYIVAKSNTAPQVVDQKLRPIFSEEDIYSGCYVNISINFSPYSAGSNKGVSAVLSNIQLVKKAAPLGGKYRAVDEFQVIEDEDEDSSSLEEIMEDFKGINDDEE